MEENERKRRREDEGADHPSDLDASDKEKPLEGLKAPKKKAQKRKAEQDVHSQDAKQAPQQQTLKKSKEQRAKEKSQKQKSKQTRKEEKKRLKKTKREAGSQPGEAAAEPASPPDEAKAKEHQNGMGDNASKSRKAQIQEEKRNTVGSTSNTGNDDAIALDNDMEVVDVTGLVPDIADAQSSASVSPAPGSTFSHTSPQPTSSNSSTVPPATEAVSKDSGATPAKTPLNKDSPSQPTLDKLVRKRSAKILSAEEAAARADQVARLAAKIQEHERRRGADGLNGKPAKNRAELIEARRLKQEKRKQHKKELRAETKEAEKKAQMEAELSKLRGSPSIGTELFSGRSSPSNNFAFGRVAFADGQRANSSLSGLVDPKKKGTQDTRAALLAAEKKKARLMGLDEGKRADIEEKDVWLNAKKKVNGERVRDDTNLLKKTLKRKEKMKNKSEKEWNERIEGVKKGQAFQQKKREENLARRKEEKGGKNKGAKKGGAKKSGTKKKNRPGFEGSFKGRA